MCYKNHKHRFMVDSLLFGLSITNDTNVISITCNGKNEAKTSLINAKSHSNLDMINLTQIKNLDFVKGESKWINTAFLHSEYPSIADHFAFAFNTKIFNDILNFIFSLINGKGDLIKFEITEKKVPVLSFKIQIIK